MHSKFGLVVEIEVQWQHYPILFQYVIVKEGYGALAPYNLVHQLRLVVL